MQFLAGMSSPLGQRAQTHHVHRNSSHMSANTHVTVTPPPPSTPTHHRANSSGGGSTTSTGSSLLSTLTSPESDSTGLVTGKNNIPINC